MGSDRGRKQKPYISAGVGGTYNRQSKFAIIYKVAQKSKPLPNDQKIVLNRIKVCQ